MKRSLFAVVLCSLISGSVLGQANEFIWFQVGTDLRAFDTATGTQVSSTPGLPGGNWGIALDGFANVWTSNFSTGQNTVSKFSNAGALLGTYAAGPTAPVGDSTVGPLAVDRDNNVYVGDPRINGNTVTKISNAGVFLYTLTTSGQSVRSICVDPNNDVWVVSYGTSGGVLQKYAQTGGAAIVTIGPGGGFAASANYVYCDEWGRVTLSHYPQMTQYCKYTLAGTLVSGPISALNPPGDGSMNNIAVAPDRKTWVVEAYIPRVEVFSATNTSQHILPGTNPTTSIAFDAQGRAWTAELGGFAVNSPIIVKRYAATGGAPQLNFTAGLISANGFSYNMGDPTGMLRARTIDPNGDMDGDSHANLLEVVAGSSPFNPNSVPSYILPMGSATIGTTYQMQIAAPGHPLGNYFMPWSLNGAPFTLGPALSPIDPRRFPISPLSATAPTTVDLFWQLSTAGGAWSTIWPNTFGTLDATGTATVSLNIPFVPGLISTTCYTAFCTLDPMKQSGIRVISQALPVTFQ